MQRELFNNMLEEFIKCFRPFNGPLCFDRRVFIYLCVLLGHDADLAHGEHEFDAPALQHLWCDNVDACLY